VSRPVALSPAADREVEEAAAWYEREAGLGEAFVDRVQEALDRIEQTPEAPRRSTAIFVASGSCGSPTACTTASSATASR
jgi:hypothetical protein